jgi:hypothetical protein
VIGFLAGASVGVLIAVVLSGVIGMAVMTIAMARVTSARNDDA